MKNLYKMITLFLALLLSGGVYAQETDQEILNATIEKTVTITKDGTQFPMHIKIMEYRDYPETAKRYRDTAADKAAKVTKLVAIDEMKDGSIEHYLVVRYHKSITDSFEFKATPDGFAFLVDDRELKYIHGNGVYFLNNNDKDFFMVQEFRDIL